MIMYKEQDGKYNFIDENDAFVGFDSQSCCCENFGWGFCNEVGKSGSEDVEALKGYNFDTSIPPIEKADDYDGGEVYITLRNKNGETAYLCLYNYHNGYYGHGWDTNWGCGGYL